MSDKPAKPTVYAASEAARCLLCNDSPCSKACGQIDTGRVIRSYFLANKD